MHQFESNGATCSLRVWEGARPDEVEVNRSIDFLQQQQMRLGSISGLRHDLVRVCRQIGLSPWHQGHSTICQPDDSHTFGRTFGGRPAREATDRRAQREPPWRQKFKLPPLRAERRRHLALVWGRITARDQPGTPDILVIFPLVSIHNSP